MSRKKSFYGSFAEVTFLPTDLAGLVFWVDADDATTINAGSPINNDPVANWNDKSGNNNDSSQATGVNQPLYKTSGFGTNSKPYIDFDGVNDFLTLGTVISKMLEHTVFVVTEVSVIGNNALFADGNSSGQAKSTSVVTALRDIGGTPMVRSVYGDGVNFRATNSSETALINTPYIIADIKTNAVALNELRSNGVGLTEVDGTGSATTIGGTAFDMSIGRAGEFNGGYTTGKIAEIVVYNNVLSAGDITSVETYLNDKYSTF